MKIGFIGTGIMGSRMAAHLLPNYELLVFNRTPDKADVLLKKGALWKDSPVKLAKQVDVLFTMLAHPQAIRETALGEQGFLAGLSPNTLWVDCSTVHPSFSRQMAAEAKQRQINFLDSPVAGSKNQAERGALVFLVGGEKTDLQTCQSLLEKMGDRIIHVGETGMGTALKLVLNLLLGTSMAAFAEGMALGEALGISQERLLKVLLGGPVTAPFLAMKQEKLAQAKYEAEFPLQWMEKDLQMVSIAAAETGTATSLANIAQAVYQQAIQQGLGEQDFSAVYLTYRELINS